MLGSLLKFERGLQTKQIGFWVVITIMFCLGLLTPWLPEIFGSSLAGEKIKANGAQMIAGSIASWDIAAIFFASIFVVTAILRDKNFKMLEIIHATPVSTFDMTSSRMMGIYLTVLTCIFANTLGQFIGQFNPNIDPEILGPINPLYYLQPMILFTAVNALVVTAFFTLIAGMTQNRMLVFVSAVGLFFFSIMTGMIVQTDLPKWFQAIIDPFANIAYALDTEFWPPEDRNTKLVPMFGYIGLNRLVWSVISALTLIAVFNRFKRGLTSGKTKLQKESLIDTGGIADYHPVKTASGFSANLAALLTRTKFEYFGTVRSVPFIIMASLAAALFAFLAIVTVFFSPQKLVPTSMFMVSLGFTSFLIPIVLIISFFSGEIVWRDKTANFTELLDSTAVKNGPLLWGKWLALCGVLITLCLVGMFVGMVVQTLVGGPPINFGLYFRYTFLNALPNYLALAFLALFVQSFMPNRIVGMIAAAAAMVFFMFVIARLPFFHPIMGFRGTSPGQISEISPYNSWVNFRWFNLYFGALCMLFAIIATWLWRRGLQTSLGSRLKSIKTEMTFMSSSLAAFCLALFIGCGTYIYHAYDKADWLNKKQTELAQVRAEKMFTRESKLPLPSISAVTIDADIYPDKQEAVVKGIFKIINKQRTPITELYISPASEHPEDVHLMEINGAVRITEGKNKDGDLIKDIEEFGIAMFKFDPPLAPGAETQIRFETFFHAPRLGDGSAISKNGTFLNNYGTFGASVKAVPTFGIPDMRLTSKDKRRKYELPEYEHLPVRTDMSARQSNLFFGASGEIDFEAKVCTQANQIPIAPGDFISETIVDNRRCREYKTDIPISNFYSILSGDYTETKDNWTASDGKVIPITIFHDEKHDYSVQNMIDATKFGFEHYSKNFSPYQYNYFNIMEVPFISFAQAFAGTIPFLERGFIMNAGDPVDIKSLDEAAITTLHELAHQWFAHQIVPSNTRGNNVLSEGLTSYAALDAYEALYGWDKAHYALEKSTIEPMVALMFIDKNKELPLATASQLYLIYNKADWVMWGLKHYIGKDKMYGAMQAFLNGYGLKGAPYPTTLQLIEYLREAAGPDYDQLITDYWDRITYWELAYGDADMKVTPNADGTFTIEIPFELDKKISSEDKPKQVSVTDINGEDLNEWIEIGFYKNTPKDKWSDWSALEKVRVSKAQSTLSFTLEARPNYVALDPRRLLIERNVTDNVKALDKKLASTK